MTTTTTDNRGLTKLQRATLADISAGNVEQRRFGYAAWRIVGASPTVVGRLISMKLARWGAAHGDTTPCLLTDAGIAALNQEPSQ